MLVYPGYNPVALQLGPVAIHWYGLAYIVALLGGLWYAKHLARRFPAPNLNVDTIEDFFIWAVLGVVVGGRLGHVFFYNPEHFLQYPLDIFKVWQGGMSFHGGAIGVTLGLFIFCWQRGIHPADLGDRIVPAVPLGSFLGRIANYINGEIWGRPTSEHLPWAMVFPHVDFLPRHPAQLYSALLEGLILGVLLWLATRKGIRRYQACGIFLTGYALARIILEMFREPAITHNIAGLILTQGQTLSLPLLVVGLGILSLTTTGKSKH